MYVYAIMISQIKASILTYLQKFRNNNLRITTKRKWSVWFVL